MAKVFSQHTDVFLQHDSSNFSIMILGIPASFKITYWHDDYGRSSTDYITSRATDYGILKDSEDLEDVIKLVTQLCIKYPEPLRNEDKGSVQKKPYNRAGVL
jgi:hypothetical protein